MVVMGMVDVLSMEASMLLNLWDGLHPESGQWRHLGNISSDLYWQHDRGLEQVPFSLYIESWRARFPGAGYGRKAIPLFQLAAELVATRIYSPDSELGEAASWEAYESLWSPVDSGESEALDVYEDEWVETIHDDYVEIPREYSPPEPGGMSALRILTAFGNGHSVLPNEEDHHDYYVPFNTSWIRRGFNFTGRPEERICEALIGGHDFGVRSAWIRHLAGVVDSFGPGPYYDSVESTPVLLFYAHLELADQLRRVSIGSTNWPFERTTGFGDHINLDVDPS